MTALELLLALSLAGVLTGVSAAQLLRPRPEVLATEIASGLQRARLEAVQRNRPVAFVLDRRSGTFTTRVKTGGATRCASSSGDLDVHAFSAASTPGLRVASSFNADPVDAALSGVLWQPSGLPARCDGVALSAGSFTLSTATVATAASVSLNANGWVSLR